jgi:glycosyltransferase involved in cell wall biosynthesis
MSIYQLLHTLSYGDAISGEVLALKRIFDEAGISGGVLAFNVHPKLKELAQTLDQQIFVNLAEGAVDAAIDLLGLKSGDTIILHYSLGSPLNQLYQALLEQRRVLIYHNITPAHWFKGINNRVFKDINSGIDQLPQMCTVSDLILADSPFNQKELVDLGFESQVLELPIDPERWRVPSNVGLKNLLRRNNKTNILHVGRLAPNKCIEDILKFFYFYHHYCNQQSQLWLVGIDTDTELYSFFLKRLAYDLGLEDAVNFTGPVADEELRALYEGSQLYVCMSEHEGFCLPVIEALNFGVPVMAFAAGALPETLGAAGVLFSEKRPAELGELAHAILQAPELLEKLKVSGKQRVANLNFDNFSQRVRELLL